METNGDAGVTTRSRSKARFHSKDRTTGTNGNVNGVISNGFHGYKEGNETLEKTEISKTIRSIMNNIVIPLSALFVCPQMAILFWYTNRECNGSYSEMISKLQQGGVFSALVKIWSELSIINSFTVSVILGYFVWAVFWMKVLPGKRVYGPVTPNGNLQKLTVRSANGQCLVWGKRPDIIRAKYTIQNGEERESILLASGWWGISRHFHYIPEIMLAILWTIPAGFDNILPYSYLIFLTVLLIHRSFRDDNKCSKKYGPYWVEYCSKVKHRIVPFLF